MVLISIKIVLIYISNFTTVCALSFWNISSLQGDVKQSKWNEFEVKETSSFASETSKISVFPWINLVATSAKTTDCLPTSIKFYFLDMIDNQLKKSWLVRLVTSTHRIWYTAYMPNVSKLCITFKVAKVCLCKTGS